MSLLGRFVSGLGTFAGQATSAAVNGKDFDAASAAGKSFLPEFFVYPSLIGSASKVDSFMSDLSDKLSSSFDSYLNGLSTSATSAQKELIESQNKFNKEEAELARTFAQTSADKAMEFEKTEAKTARDWSKMMSDTAYQRAVADLKAAGLNPVLAFGSPAGSGQASYASGKTAASSAAKASTTLDPSRAKEADTSIPALIAGLLGSAAKIFDAIS